MEPTLRFCWDKPSLSGVRLQAYASLLRVQTDGQVHERPKPGSTPTDGDGEDSVDGDGDSIAAGTLTSFGATRLREAFQDRVAELVANVKGGQHVAGTMFVNTAQSLTLVVAKNNGIEGRDRRFLERLQEQLRKVSRMQGNSMAIVKCDESNMLCQPDAMLGVEMRSGTISCSTAMRGSVSGLLNSAPMLRFSRKATPRVM